MKKLLSRELLSDILNIDKNTIQEVLFKDNQLTINHSNFDSTGVTGTHWSDIISSCELIDRIEQKAIEKGYSIVVGYDLKKKTFKGKYKWIYRCTNVKFCEIEKSSEYIYSDDKLEIWIKNYKDLINAKNNNK